MGLKESVRDWLRQTFAWDFAEKQRMQRAAMATGLGLNPEQYARPFPGSQSTHNVTIQQGGGMGKLIGIGALVLGALAAGAAGPLAWMALSQRPQVQQEQKVEDVELEVRWKLGPDGKWETVVEPIKR